MSRQIKHKFNAKSVNDNGHFYASKLEYRYAKQLELRQKSGEILFFLTQVPIRLPGGKKYMVDFVEYLSNGEVIFTDCKGMMTPMSKFKIDQVEALYPFTINVVRKV